MARKKNLIADLPSGFGITKSHSGRGRMFYGVRLGSRFTGGPIFKKDFNTVHEARTWIFGDAQSHRAAPGAVIDLKDGDRRIVDLPDNLIQWLLACWKESGALLPVNFRRKRWALCRTMNWKEWPDDILRHSYGSYHLAKHRNAALTAEQMGHKNARMLYALYREVVKDAGDRDTPTTQLAEMVKLVKGGRPKGSGKNAGPKKGDGQLSFL